MDWKSDDVLYDVGEDEEKRKKRENRVREQTDIFIDNSQTLMRSSLFTSEKSKLLSAPTTGQTGKKAEVTS